jgi:5-methylcytosine-specific restriction endonuclease McrA
MTGSSSWCGRTKRIALYIRSNWTCGYCGRDLRGLAPEEVGLDHLEDLVDGGGHAGANHAASNLIMVCRRCNSQRGNRAWREYAPAGSQDRIDAIRVQPLNMAMALGLLKAGTAWADR